MWVQSLSQEDPLEEGTATHFNILAWKIPQTEEPVGKAQIETDIEKRSMDSKGRSEDGMNWEIGIHLYELPSHS